MARRHSATALGASLFLVVLSIPVVWGMIMTSLVGHGEASAETSWDLALRARPETAIHLGWLLPVACPDPVSWEAIPGIGPSLARRLASAAAAGEFKAPTDLLRVRGIGVKIAARIAPRLDWRPWFELDRHQHSPETLDDSHLYGPQRYHPCSPRGVGSDNALLQ